MSEERLDKIERKLDRLCVLLETHRNHYHEQSKQRREWESQIRSALYGNGTEGGIQVRLDRLEQSEGRLRWLIRAIVGGVIMAVVGAFVAIFQ